VISLRRCYRQRRNALYENSITPWYPSLSKATHAIWYWTIWISRNGIRYADNSVLEYYLEHLDVDATNFYTTLTLHICAAELRNAKARFKDILADAISNSDLYEVDIVTVRVKRRHPHPTEDNVAQTQEREVRIYKEFKQRETRQSTQKSFRKLGYQIRGHMKPKSTKKLCLNRLDVQTEDGLWRQIVGKDQVKEHLIEHNVEHFSHAAAIPLGYMEMGQALGHTSDTLMMFI
jgi:hypothetical protein